jgi:hypothetical protein
MVKTGLTSLRIWNNRRLKNAVMKIRVPQTIAKILSSCETAM